MVDLFRCLGCAARLVGLVGLDPRSLGPCPGCGSTNWSTVRKLSAGGSIAPTGRLGLRVTRAGEGDALLAPEPQVIAPDLVEQPLTAFDPAIEAEPLSIDWPTDEELDRLAIHADSTVMGLVLHAPGDDRREDHWIAELMIDGQWSYTFRVGITADGAIEDAAIRFSEYVREWWAAVRRRRYGEE